MESNIHDKSVIHTAGSSITEAERILVALHGRGGSAQDILRFADSLELEGVHIRAPEADGQVWYPHRFMEPQEKNQPHLDSALSLVDSIISELEGEGFSRSSVHLLGFSQGACLALEYAVRKGEGLGGVFVLSGGLIGTEEELDRHTGDLKDLPVFIGCGDSDHHIPVERVEKSESVFDALHARPEVRIYPGMGHTINEDEVRYLKEFFA